MLYGAWRFPTFAWQTATLSSALGGFTSEFGMGSGGSRPLWSPSNLVHSPQGPAGLRRPLPGHPFTCFPYRGCSVLSAGRVRPAFCFGWEAFGHTSCAPCHAPPMEICTCFSLLRCQLSASPCSGSAFGQAPHAPLPCLPPKPIGCYMVKPHGQLVHVSCTHCCASTPCLSTS